MPVTARSEEVRCYCATINDRVAVCAPRSCITCVFLACVVMKNVMMLYYTYHTHHTHPAAKTALEQRMYLA